MVVTVVVVVVMVMRVATVSTVDRAPWRGCFVWQMLLVARAQIETMARSARLLVASTATGHGGEWRALLASSVVVARHRIFPLGLLRFVFDPRHKPTGQLNTDFCAIIAFTGSMTRRLRAATRHYLRIFGQLGQIQITTTGFLPDFCAPFVELAASGGCHV